MTNIEINNNIEKPKKILIFEETQKNLIDFNENELFINELSLAIEKDIKPKEEKYIKFFNDILV